MQTLGPYSFRDRLGTGPAGSVWRAVDQYGGQVTLAVLEGNAAGDPRARWQFTSVVDQARHAGSGTPLASDLVGPQPWVAFPDDGGATAAGLFAAFGAPVTPLAAPPGGGPYPPGAAMPTSPGPHGSHPEPQQSVPQQPLSQQPVPQQPVPQQPVPQPAFDQPAEHPPEAPVDPFGPPAAQVPGPVEPFQPGSPAPFSSSPPPHPQREWQTTPERPRRRGLLIGVLVVVVLVLAGGAGGAIYLTGGHGGDARAQESSSPTPVTSHRQVSSSPTPHVQHSAPSRPKHPGKEPPKNGSWPASFAAFGSHDKTTTLSHLPGVGFPVRVPAGWTCTKRDQSTSYVNYHCGSDRTGAGGDLIVRTCYEPCSAAKKIRMRESEEAWGLQWVRDGGNCSWADSSDITGPDGAKQYGLVMVRYWHSRPGGPMDRQLVLRMTAPKSDAAEIQKVANAARDATQ